MGADGQGGGAEEGGWIAEFVARRLQFDDRFFLICGGGGV